MVPKIWDLSIKIDKSLLNNWVSNFELKSIKITLKDTGKKSDFKLLEISNHVQVSQASQWQFSKMTSFLYPLCVIKVPPQKVFFFFFWGGGSPKNISKSNFWSDPRVELPVNKIIFFFISKKSYVKSKKKWWFFLCIQKVWKQCRRRLMYALNRCSSSYERGKRALYIVRQCWIYPGLWMFFTYGSLQKLDFEIFLEDRKIFWGGGTLITQ